MPNIANEAATIGRTQSAQKKLGASYVPTPTAPALAPKSSAATPEQGPTNFWGRISQVGIGKLNALNAYKTVVEHKAAINSNNSVITNGAKKVATGVNNAAKDVAHTIITKGVKQGVTQAVEKPAGATARFLGSGTAKLANQGYQEGKQAVDTVKMQAAARSNNPVAFSNAQNQSNKDYKGFKTSGGLLNVGTATNEQESKKGDLKTGIKKIGGADLEAASELVPMAEFGKAAKVYKLGQGVIDASESAAKSIAKNVVLGTLSGGVGNAGAQLLENGKVSWKGVAKGAAAGGILSAGAEAATKGIGLLHTIFKEGPTAALDKLHAKPEVKPTGEMDDVLSEKQLNKASAAVRTDIPVKDETAVAEKVGVTTPTRPGIKEVSQTDSVQVKTPVKVTPEDYTKRFNDLSKSYDKAYSALENKTPAEQKVLGQVIDNQHIKALEKLNEDYKSGIVSESPSKVTKISSETSKAGKTTGGKAETTVPSSVSNSAQKLAGNKIAPTPKARAAEAPRTTKAEVESGGSKVSGSALRSEREAVQAGLKDEFKDKASYNSGSFKAEADNATKLVHDDPQKALDIATGKAPGNNTLHESAVYHAVKEKAIADNDYETMQKLVSSSRHTEVSEAAQKLGSEGYHRGNDPIKIMKEVADRKTAAVEKKLGSSVKETIAKDVKTAQSQIKAPSKGEWKMFVESLKC